MADIAYLLLIFIIIISLSGTKKYSVKDIPISKSVVREKEPGIIIIIKENDIFLNSLSLNNDEKILERELKKYIKKTLVKIIANKSLKFGRIKKVIKTLELNGFYSIQFIVKRFN